LLWIERRCLHVPTSQASRHCAWHGMARRSASPAPRTVPPRSVALGDLGCMPGRLRSQTTSSDAGDVHRRRETMGFLCPGPEGERCDLHGLREDSLACLRDQTDHDALFLNEDVLAVVEQHGVPKTPAEGCAQALLGERQQLQRASRCPEFLDAP